MTSTDHKNPDKDDGGAYYAEGCNKIRRYTTRCDNAGCHDIQGVDVLSLMQNQASADLQCSPNTLIVVHLNVDMFGVVGCKRQVNYQVQCEGESCRLIHHS